MGCIDSAMAWGGTTVDLIGENRSLAWGKRMGPRLEVLICCRSESHARARRNRHQQGAPYCDA